MNDRLPHIALVEDDAAIRVLMLGYLEDAGFCVSEADSAAAFYSVFDSGGVDLVLLDLNLPDGDGMEVARRLRRCSDVPIVIVSVRDQDRDRIAGLELGADDYLTKPFHPRELIARVNNVLRRAKGSAPTDDDGVGANGSLHMLGAFNLDLTRRRLFDGRNREVSLTRGEFDLLAALAKADERILSRDQLIDAVSRRSEPPDERVVDVMISRLRRKLESDPQHPSVLLTVPGVGYRLAVKPKG